jgi:hypothetical protein
VIGDAKAGITTQRIGRDPAVLAHLGGAVGDAAVKVLHVVRNPFDPIAVMRIRGGRTSDAAIDRYFSNCDILRDLHERLDPNDIHLVRYEAVVESPVAVLAEVCRFLGLEAADEYLAACGDLVRPSSSRERGEIDWAASSIRRIEALIAQYEFLSGYQYET